MIELYLRIRTSGPPQISRAPARKDGKMIGRRTGFVSEHSAEFAVLPELSRILRRTYSSIVPVYYWLRREGGALARSIHANDEIEALALFPRRPKLRYADDNTIAVTINNQVKGAADVLAARGIASVCGCPLARSFWELGDQPQCAFIGLSDKTADEYEFDISGHPASPDDEVLHGSDELVSFIRGRARCLRLEELDLAVRESRDPLGRSPYGMHMFSAGYKPVIVLLRQ